MSNEINELNPNDVILEERELLELKIEDDELVLGIDKAIAKSNVIKINNDYESSIRAEYWKHGTDAKTLKRIHPKKAKTVNNRIWANILTILPYWINRTPEPNVVSTSINNSERESVVKFLINAWEIDNDMKWLTQQVALHWLINHIGILKIRWNDKSNGIETVAVLPKKMGFDSKATKLENCDYVWEILEDSADNLIKKYPSKKKQILKIAKGRTKVKYIEFWGDNGKWVAWKLKDIILDKKKNPNFDYDYDNPENNLFKEPKFPYIVLSCFNLGENIYDDSGLIDQAIPLQDSVNKLERQILDLNDGQKRTWIGSAEAISRESFQKVIDKTGDLGIYMDRKIPQGGLQLPMSGKPDQSLFNDLEHLLSEIDNVMGVHAALRGQYTPGMSKLGMRGYGMMIQQDLAKDLVVSRIEQLAENWFNMYIQMAKVYKAEGILFNMDVSEIPQGIRIMVKKGSMLPVDKASRAEMAFKLAGMSMEAPADMYNDLGYGNAEKRLQHLQEFVQGQIVPSEMTPDGQKLTRLKELMSSPEFQQLPPEQKAIVVQDAKKVVEGIKVNKGQVQQPIQQPTQQPIQQ